MEPVGSICFCWKDGGPESQIPALFSVCVQISYVQIMNIRHCSVLVLIRI